MFHFTNSKKYGILIVIYFSELLMPIVPLNVGDKILLKKKHPCSSDVFKIARVGSDIKVICEGCGRSLMLPREKIEKMIKKVLSK
jgi:hypothetical protein